jgi:hypothetical protein
VTSVNVSTVTNTITVTDGDNSATVVATPVTNTITIIDGDNGATVVAAPVVNTVTVIDGSSIATVVTVPIVNTVTATTVGPQGPAGAGYLHQQTSSSTTWIINHNLGFRPAVELFDSGSQEIDGDVAHPSVNQAIITLSPATTGTARLT